MKSLIKNLIIFAALAGLLYAGYVLFFQGGNQVLDTGENSEGQLLTNEFLVRLGELEQISFDRQLFDDPRFRSLSSFGTAPEQVSFGRPNPFAR